MDAASPTKLSRVMQAAMCFFYAEAAPRERIVFWSEARRLSARWLCSMVISSKRTLAPGERCARIGMSVF
jgi:hypothetical protein